MNTLKNGTIAIGAPGSMMRAQAELEDAAKEHAIQITPRKESVTIKQVAKKDGPLSGNYYVAIINGVSVGCTSVAPLVRRILVEGFVYTIEKMP